MLCDALAKNKTLKVLNLGINKLDNVGMELLSGALYENTALEYLDLFDCFFSNDGASYLEHALRKNSTLRWLRLSNTQVTTEISQLLIDTIF
jgi:Ran GTPase-activating protein (RanGAP) involved in mRNA processing and transport